jgi:hypothetical protein
MSPVATEGRRVVVPSGALSIWVPADWEIVERQVFELLALAPADEDVYRANLSVLHVNVASGLTMDEVVQSTARIQSANLQTFVEYDRRRTRLAGLDGVHREYAWVQDGTGLVLYQLEELAMDAAVPPGDGASPRLLEVHATSSAPAYFRYAALLRRMLESIERQSVA